MVGQHFRRQRLDDFAARRRQAHDQFGRGLEAVAVVAPVRSIANDQYPALAGIGAACRAVRHAVDGEGVVVGLERQLDGGGDLVDRFGTLREYGVQQIGFVAAGDDHSRAVARTDIAQRQEDVDLTAAELPVVIAELGADAALVRARVDTGGGSLAADISKRLVDK